MTGEDLFTWIECEPKKYYRQGVLHGLIKDIEGQDGILYLACTTRHIDDKFTKDMIKDIIMFGKTRNVCLITDVQSKQELIAKALTKWRTSVKYKDGNMYTYCTSKGR